MIIVQLYFLIAVALWLYLLFHPRLSEVVIRSTQTKILSEMRPFAFWGTVLLAVTIMSLAWPYVTIVSFYLSFLKKK